MRSSSRRLNLTSFAGAVARASPPRHMLGSISPMSMRRLLCHLGFMIAPDGGVGKGFLSGKITPSQKQTEDQRHRCDISDRRNHAFVKRIIIRTNFGQARAKLTCEK